jgi:MFS transporter, FHS family, L-fucose permease
MAITTVNSTSAPTTANAPATSNKVALTVVTTLFFMWGFITVLNDVLVPHLKSIFDLSYAKVMLIQFAFFTAYFIFALPWAKVVDKVGYKMTMVLGLLTMGVGAFLFIPAASVPSYPLFLGALMVLAGGMTALQVAANPYVAVLGPPQTASSRLNLAQAFNSLGTTIGPFIGGILILTAAPKAMEVVRQMSAEAQQVYRIHEASSVKLPYMVIGLLLIVMAISIAMFKLPAMPGTEKHGKLKGESVWKHSHLVLGAIGIFVYVGAEVSIGSFLINYLSQPNIGNLSEVQAAKYVSAYWFGAMVGRFLGSAILQKVRSTTVLGIAAFGASLLVIITMLTTGNIAMWSIILVGFFNSVMFPSIFTLGIAELGPLTGDGSGLLIMAIVGGALIPFAQGWLADHIGIHHAFILPAICYLYIIYYAFKGSKPQPFVAAA